MNGINQLASGRHQLAPEVLVVTAHHQVHVVFLDRIYQHLAQVAAAAQGFGNRVARVGGQFAQGVVRLFGDTLLHIAQIDVDQTGVKVGVIHINVNQRNFRVVGTCHGYRFINQHFALGGEVYRDENVFVSHSVTPSLSYR